MDALISWIGDLVRGTSNECQRQVSLQPQCTYANALLPTRHTKPPEEEETPASRYLRSRHTTHTPYKITWRIDVCVRGFFERPFDRSRRLLICSHVFEGCSGRLAMSSFRLLELALTSRQPRMSWRNSIGGLMIDMGIYMPCLLGHACKTRVSPRWRWCRPIDRPARCVSPLAWDGAGLASAFTAEGWQEYCLPSLEVVQLGASSPWHESCMWRLCGRFCISRHVVMDVSDIHWTYMRMCNILYIYIIYIYWCIYIHISYIYV